MRPSHLVPILLLASFAVPSEAWTAPECPIPPRAWLERPETEAGPTEIRVGLHLVDFGAVHHIEQSFHGDIYMTFSWVDSRLASASGCRYARSAVWNPEIELVNGRELRPQPPPEVVIGSGGAVRLNHRYSGTFSSPLDLRDFPFDRQRLPISFASVAYGPEQIAYTLAPASARAEPFSVAGWEISNFDRWTDDVKAISGNPGRSPSHARFHYALDAERHPGGYFVRAIVPLCLIVFMAYAVFWIDPSHTAPQIGVATTSMLTTIAFLFALQRNLPPVPYLTRLDHFIYGCLVLVFLAFAEAILTTALTTGGRHAAALNLDRIMRGLFPASVLLLAWVALF